MTFLKVSEKDLNADLLPFFFFSYLPSSLSRMPCSSTFNGESTLFLTLLNLNHNNL